MQNLSIITPVGTKKRYLNVLKKCFLLNIMMLGVITLSTIAKAETAETTLTPSEELETVVYDSSNFSRTTISSDTTIDLAGKNLTYSGIESSASGGVFHVNSDKTLEFINSDETTDPLLLFENNTATKYGRAISNYGDVTFDSESSFISNSSDLGGAILNYGYIMFNEVAIFSNNSGLSYGVGGAIYNDYGSTITFGEGSTAIFSGNTASDGGAIDNFGDITFGGEATTFTNNSAGSVGGAIYNGGSITFGGETTFTNNSAGSVGGAIDNGEGSIIFYGETIFSENEASVGGAICNDGTITFDNKATFTDNSANYGGAIENYAYNSNATITFGEVSTATFSGNEASQYGGAIENYADNSDVNATITFGEGSSATFMGNTADVGGAIYNYTDNSNATITFGEGSTATFSDNTAYQYGGAIVNEYGEIIFNGETIFSENEAPIGGTIANGGIITFSGDAEFSGNSVTGSAEFGGGAIYNEAGITFGKAATFTGNSAGSYGGAIYNGGDITFGGEATFTNNTADNKGGAIWNDGNITFGDKATFTNNTADDGGAIYNGGDITFSKGSINSFTGNEAIFGGAILNSNTIDFYGKTTFTENIASSIGGAVYNKGGVITFAAETIFSGNEAAYGGAIDNYNGGTITFGSEATFTNNTASSGGAIFNEYNITFGASSTATFSGNEASERGGAIYNNYDADITFDGEATFTGNSAGSGGAIYNSGGTITFGDKATFTNNSVTGSASTFGGAIYNNYDADITFDGEATFTGNSAGSGGAIYNKYDADITFDGEATFTGNSASFGGAIYNEDGDITFGGEATFTNNSATNLGGAIANENGMVTFGENVTFANNSAENAGTILNVGTIEFNKMAVFTDNSADYAGGAIANGGTITFSGDAEFSGNSVTDSAESGGGAIWNTAGITFGKAATFTGNSAGSVGGAIYNEDGDITFGGAATFTSNSADDHGGAIYNAEDGTITFGDKATFANNSITGLASTFGGAILNYGDITFGGDAIFSNNSAYAGGAIYNSGGTITFGDKATFTNNSATGENSTFGGAIDNYYGDITFGGDAIFSNNSAYAGGAIYNSGGTITFNNSFLFSENTAIQGADIYNGGTITIAGDKGTVGSLDGGIYQSPGTINKTGAGTLILGDNMVNGYYGSNTQFNQSAGLTIAKTDKLTFAKTNTISGGELRVHGDSLNPLSATISNAKLTYLTTSTAEQEVVMPTGITLNNVELVLGTYTDKQKQVEVDLMAVKKVPVLDAEGNVVYNQDGSIEYVAYDAAGKLLTTNTIDRANYVLNGDIAGASKVTFKDSDIKLGASSYTGTYEIGSSNKIIINGEGKGEQDVSFNNLIGEGATLALDVLFTQNADGTVSMQTDKLNLSGSAYEFADVDLNMYGEDIFKATIDQMANLLEPVVYNSQVLRGEATFKDINKSWLETTSPYAYEISASNQTLSVSANKLKGTVLEYLANYAGDSTLQFDGDSGALNASKVLGPLSTGTKAILGASDDASESVIQGVGQNLFQVDKADTTLEMKNLTLKGVGTAIDNQAGKVALDNVIIQGTVGDTALKNANEMTLKDVVVDKAVENEGSLTIVNSKVGGMLENKATLTAVDVTVDTLKNSGAVTLEGENTIATLNNERAGKVDLLTVHQLKEVINDGQISTSSDIAIESLSGIGTLSINNATLDVADKFNTSNKVISNNMVLGDKVQEISFKELEIKEGTTLDIDNKHVTADKVTFGKESTLSVTLNHLQDHGTLSHEEVAGDEEAKLILKLTEGLDQEEGIYQVFNKDNNLALEKNGLIDVIDMQDGSYKVAKKSVETLSQELGTTKEESTVANALLSGNSEKEEFVQVQTELLDALQSENKATFARAKKALNAVGGTQKAVVQSVTSGQFNKLQTVVSNMMHQPTSPVGRSAGDEIARASVYIKGLYDKTKSTMGDGFESTSKGAVLGIQSKVTEDLTLGVGYAVTNSKIEEDLRETEADTNTVFASALYKPSKAWVSGVLSYSRGQYEESKQILSSIAKGGYNVDSWGVQVMVGYDAEIGNAIITPEAGVRYMHVKQESYTDTLGTNVQNRATSTATALVGVKGVFDYDWIRPSLGVTLGYDFKQDDVASVNTLANGATYSIAGEQMEKLSTNISLGMEADLTERTALAVEYIASLRKDYTEHSGTLKLEHKF